MEIIATASAFLHESINWVDGCVLLLVCGLLVSAPLHWLDCILNICVRIREGLVPTVFISLIPCCVLYFPIWLPSEFFIALRRGLASPDSKQAAMISEEPRPREDDSDIREPHHANRMLVEPYALPVLSVAKFGALSIMWIGIVIAFFSWLEFPPWSRAFVTYWSLVSVLIARDYRHPLELMSRG
jgi:hypothetical protein